MEKERRASLVAQLAHDIEHSRYISRTNGEVYVGYKKHYLDEEYYGKYITIEEFSDLVNLYEFLINFKDIDAIELKKMFKMNPQAFAFLRKLNKQYKDLITELRDHGPQWILTCYCGDKRFKEACKCAIWD